jgi:hypothetical protein
MSYSVIGLSTDQVRYGHSSYVLKLLSDAIHEINSEIAKSKPGSSQLDEVIILSTEFSKNHPEELTKPYGNYEMFLFLNPLAKRIASIYKMDFNYVGAAEEPPSNAILLMRNYLIGEILN